MMLAKRGLRVGIRRMDAKPAASSSCVMLCGLRHAPDRIARK